MNLERRTASTEPAQAADLSGAGASEAQAAVMMRDRGRALLDAADAAINRALSRDSSQFLAQGRQSGGQ